MTAIRDDDPTPAAPRADVDALTERVRLLERRTHDRAWMDAQGVLGPSPPPAVAPVTQASRDDLDGMPMWKPVETATAPDDDDPRWAALWESVESMDFDGEWPPVRETVRKAIELGLVAPADNYPTREEVAEWDAVYRGDPAPDEDEAIQEMLDERDAVDWAGDSIEAAVQALVFAIENSKSPHQIIGKNGPTHRRLRHALRLAAPADRAVVCDVTDWLVEQCSRRLFAISDREVGEMAMRHALNFAAAYWTAPAGVDTTGEP